MRTFMISPRGSFDLATAREFAGGFPAGLGASAGADGAILMTFPVEGWDASAVVQLRQQRGDQLIGTVEGDGDLDVITQQVARSLSVDVDGTEWPDVGRRDPVIGTLQARHGLLRPVCFYSAYEAATSFVIGQRISMVQTRRIKAGLAERVGDRVHLDVDGEPQSVAVFPGPRALATLTEARGLSDVKVERLRAIARATLDGDLDTDSLRALPENAALDRLRTLPGVGEWTATAILTRGCGVPDTIPFGDSISRGAVRHFYELSAEPDDATWASIAEPWRPFRMWATVLLHMAWRREAPARPSYRQERRGATDRRATT